jgi:hypothetical protein
MPACLLQSGRRAAESETVPALWTKTIEVTRHMLHTGSWVLHIFQHPNCVDAQVLNGMRLLLLKNKMEHLQFFMGVGACSTVVSCFSLALQM